MSVEIETDDPIVHETHHTLGSMEYSRWHFGYVGEVNTRSVYVDWDDPNDAVMFELPERLNKSDVKLHPFKDKRPKKK